MQGKHINYHALAPGNYFWRYTGRPEIGSRLARQKPYTMSYLSAPPPITFKTDSSKRTFVFYVNLMLYHIQVTRIAGPDSKQVNNSTSVGER